MKGYPKYINTKQDFENLLAISKFRKRALKDLQIISKMNDALSTRVISGSEETKDLVIEEIDNPMPMWKQKGFITKKELHNLISAMK